MFTFDRVKCQCPIFGTCLFFEQLKTDIPFEDKSHMKHEVQDIKKELIVAQQQIVDMRKQVQAYKRILGLEIGTEIVPIQLDIFHSNWRDRAREKNFLKSELVSIVDLRIIHDKEHPFNQGCLPSMIDTSREVLLTQRDMDLLLDLYLNYNSYMTATKTPNEKGAAEAFKDYFKLTKEYEMKLLQNNAMMDEINAIRKRIKELILQSEEDKSFMTYLLSLNHNRNSQSPVREEEVKTSNKNKHEIENNEKYKNLLEANCKENEKIQMKLNDVKKDIRETNRRLVEAEKLCALNRMNFRSLEKEARELSKKSICAERQPFAVDDASAKDFRIVLQDKIDQLGATKRENVNLKNILHHEILLKTQDFNRFRESLEAMAAKYRSTIEQIRDKQNATEHEKESKK